MRSIAYVAAVTLVAVGLALGLVLAPVARAETSPAQGPPRLEIISRGEGEIVRGIVQRRNQAKALGEEADALWRDLVAAGAARLKVAPEQLGDIKPNDKGELAWVIAPAPVAPVTTTTTKK